MKNQCFIHKNKPQILVKENLNLFYFGKKKISFGICRNCGLIFQTESVKKSEMIKSYKNMVLYVDNLSKPSKNKLKTIKRHMLMIKNEVVNFPKKVLEVSSMNSYTLNKFKKNGSNQIASVEPSIRIAKLFSKEGIKTYNTTIEKLKTKIKYDLIIMSHVLEHLYNPLLAIKKCYNIQKIGQKILIEVPLFEKVENYAVGALQIEHLHYFSEKNIIEVITRGGYRIDKVNKIFKNIEAPVITIIATKIKSKNFKKANDYKNQMYNFKKYESQSIRNWKVIKNNMCKIDKKKPLYFYGAGWFASQLLYYTDTLKNFNNFKGFIDSSKNKQNKKILNFKIFPPNFNKIENNSQIVISSISTQKSIYKFVLKNKLSSQKIIKLFKGY
tara:strand:+ start:138 stop:1289 length:1152 start_codon:yes stop_codon:yes gene_type:complete